MLVELRLGTTNAFLKIFIGQLRGNDRVPVTGQEGRFYASWKCSPAVEEKNLHRDILGRKPVVTNAIVLERTSMEMLRKPSQLSFQQGFDSAKLSSPIATLDAAR